MFLFERIVGVATYSIIMIIACNGIGVSKERRSKYALIAYACMIGFLGLIYVPYETADLSRLLQYMHSWAYMDFETMIEACRNTTSPVYLLYFWIVGQFHIDGLLPAITAFLGYSLIFSCIWDYSQRNNCSNKQLALVVAFLMSTTLFMGFISGIRNSLATSLVFYAWYSEMYRNRSVLLVAPIYVIAALLHPAAIILIAYRLVLYFFQSESPMYKRLFNGFFGIVILVAFLIYGDPYMSVIAEKGSSYLSGIHYSYVWEQLISAVEVIVVGVAVKRAYRVLKTSPVDKSLLIMLISLLVLMVAAFFINYTIFIRFSQFLLLWGLLPIIRVLKEEESLPKSKKKFSQMFVVVTILLLVLSCSRGSLCSYKFFEIMG